MVNFKFISELIPEKQLKNDSKKSILKESSKEKSFKEIDSLVNFWDEKRLQLLLLDLI